MTLNDALAPMTLDEFCGRCLGRQFAHIRGARGRFNHFVPWDELDDALCRLRATDDRVMLIKQGRPVRRSSYVYSSPNGQVHYLIGQAVLAHVGDGASLVLNQADELFPTVRSFAEACEDVFRVHVQANLYGAWRTDNGFDLHWDGHDTLIVQVVGRKRWTVWEPTELHPLTGKSARVATAPAALPVWEGLLEDGDVLYMPRGWWHVAVPTGEPSVHVTFGIKHPTGIDMLTWVVAQLDPNLDVRCDVPHWRSPQERHVWVETLRELFTTALNDETIEQFMRAAPGRPHQRGVVALPRTSIAGASAIDDHTPLRLCVWERPRLDATDGGKLRFALGGFTWHGDAGVRSALNLLHPVSASTLAGMLAVVPSDLHSSLRAIISALLSEKLVWAEPMTRRSASADGANV